MQNGIIKNFLKFWYNYTLEKEHWKNTVQCSTNYFWVMRLELKYTYFQTPVILNFNKILLWLEKMLEVSFPWIKIFAQFQIIALS